MLIKLKKKGRFLILWLVIASFLYACSDQDPMRDLHTYLELMKKAVAKHPHKNILAEIQLPKPVVFDPGTKVRDPFQAEQTVYTGGALSNPLTAYPTKAFELEGTIVRNNQAWAVIRAPDDKVYQVTINDRIGNHYGRIIQINPDQMKVEEQVSTSEAGIVGQGVIKQIVTLQLKGEN